METAVPRKILIADDNALNRKLLETLLRDEGYALTSVASGAEALCAIDRERPDVLLLDLMMPGMDGFEVVRRLRTNGQTANLPIVMVTSLDDDGARTRLASAGVTEIITKPLDRWVLKARLEQLFRAEGDRHE